MDLPVVAEENSLGSRLVQAHSSMVQMLTTHGVSRIHQAEPAKP